MITAALGPIVDYFFKKRGDGTDHGEYLLLTLEHFSKRSSSEKVNWPVYFQNFVAHWFREWVGDKWGARKDAHGTRAVRVCFGECTRSIL